MASDLKGDSTARAAAKATPCVECGHTEEIENCLCRGNPRLNFRPCPCAGGPWANRDFAGVAS